MNQDKPQKDSVGTIGTTQRLYRIDMAIVEATIHRWNALPRRIARQTITQYGPPHELSPGHLTWYNNGCWKRTIVYRDEIPHKFPQPHMDVIENVIDYQVPAVRQDDVARFDGNLIRDKQAGELRARCHMEAANFVAINLAHDIVRGIISVTEARRRHTELIAAYLAGRPVPYAEGLNFVPGAPGIDVPGTSAVEERQATQEERGRREQNISGMQSETARRGA